MKLARLIVRLEERKVVAGRLARDSFALFAAISYYVSTCNHAVCVPWAFAEHALALSGDAKQAMVEGKWSG